MTDLTQAKAVAQRLRKGDLPLLSTVLGTIDALIAEVETLSDSCAAKADRIDRLGETVERLKAACDKYSEAEILQTKVDVDPNHECPVCHHQQRSITYTCNNCGCGVDIEYPTLDDAGAKLEVENKRLRKALQSCLDYFNSPSTKNLLSDDMQADKIKEAMKVDI